MPAVLASRAARYSSSTTSPLRPARHERGGIELGGQGQRAPAPSASAAAGGGRGRERLRGQPLRLLTDAAGRGQRERPSRRSGEHGRLIAGAQLRQPALRLVEGLVLLAEREAHLAPAVRADRW